MTGILDTVAEQRHPISRQVPLRSALRPFVTRGASPRPMIGMDIAFPSAWAYRCRSSLITMRICRTIAAAATWRPGRSWRGCCCWRRWPGRSLPAASIRPTIWAAFHLPLRAFYAERLARGQPYDWMPQLFSGFYLTGEGQAGVYHPAAPTPVPIPSAARRPGIGVPALLSADDARHVAAAEAAAGPQRRRHARRLAVYVLQLQSAALRSSQRRGRDRPRPVAAVGDRRRAGRFAAAKGRPGHGADRPVDRLATAAGLSAIRLVLAAGRRLLSCSSCRRRARYTARSGCDLRATCDDCVGCTTQTWPRVVIAKEIGLLLGGVQLLPTLDAWLHSARMSADADFASWGSLHPLNLLQLVAPYLLADRVIGDNTHEFGLYVGAVPLVLSRVGGGPATRTGIAGAAGVGDARLRRCCRCCWHSEQYGFLYRIIDLAARCPQFPLPLPLPRAVSAGGRRVGGDRVRAVDPRASGRPANNVLGGTPRGQRRTWLALVARLRAAVVRGRRCRRPWRSPWQAPPRTVHRLRSGGLGGTVACWRPRPC